MWLLESAVRQAIEHAYSSNAMPSADQQAQYEARYGFEPGSSARVLSVAGDTAEINVSGVITKSPSFMAMLFGGGNTTYPEIMQALAEADQDPAITKAVMRIDSPGGHVDGLFDTVAAMEAFSKPLKAMVHNQAASAAYALASQADEIVAANRAARVGSIGIVKTFSLDKDHVDIASTKAPRKRPDVNTAEGKSVVLEELDALHELFVDAIATGRGTTPDKVNAEFGQGSTLLADDALKRGMIDAVAEKRLHVVKSPKTQTTTASGGDQPETGPMDRNTLKAQHPDVYASIVQEERDRVSAHLEMGEASNALDLAIAAIKAGEDYTTKHMASYNAAALRSRDQSNRQDDDGAAAAAADGAAQDDNSVDAADLVCSAVEAKLGIAGE